MRMYPAEGYPDNKAGAFSMITAPNEPFILTYDGEYLYKKNVEISAVYRLDEQLGYEVLIYRDIYTSIFTDLIIYGDAPKDTFYFGKHSISAIMQDHLMIQLNP